MERLVPPHAPVGLLNHLLRIHRTASLTLPPQSITPFNESDFFFPSRTNLCRGFFKFSVDYFEAEDTNMWWLTGRSSDLVSECPLLGIVQTAFMLFEAVWRLRASLPESKASLKNSQSGDAESLWRSSWKINRNTPALLREYGVKGPLLRVVWLSLYDRSRNLVSLMALSWQFRNYRTSFLLSADDVVSLVSSNQDLQINWSSSL